VRAIQPSESQVPAGHYVPGIRTGDLVFVSGQLPLDAAGVPQPDQPIEEQVDLALANLDAVLRAAGSSRERVVKVNVYVSDIALWDRVNRRYAAFFGNHRPARAVVPVGPLHYGCAIEIDAVAEC
jgi:2-iminobutanoate/2-iminopropanoate deaminase